MGRREGIRWYREKTEEKNKLVIKISYNVVCQNNNNEVIDTNTYNKLSENHFRHHPEFSKKTATVDMVEKDKSFNLYKDFW